MRVSRCARSASASSGSMASARLEPSQRLVVPRRPLRQIAEADRGAREVERARQRASRLHRAGERGAPARAFARELERVAEVEQRCEAERCIDGLGMVERGDRLFVVRGGLLECIHPRGARGGAQRTRVGALRIAHRERLVVMVGELGDHAIGIGRVPCAPAPARRARAAARGDQPATARRRPPGTARARNAR